MFLGGLAIVGGSTLTPAEWFTGNLIPATLGNIIGGSICVACSYASIYGTPGNDSSTEALVADKPPDSSREEY